MKFNLTSLLVIIIIIFSVNISLAKGPTPVGGEIREDQTWTKEDSPYIVTRDVTVRPNVTLYIEAGSKVLFQEIDYPKEYTNRGVLKVQGELVVVGTKAEPVVFSLQNAKAIGDWGGIWIDGTFGGKARIEYAQISYAQRGVYIQNASESNRVSIENTLINTNFTGIHIENSEGVDVRSSQVMLNDYGIYLQSSLAVLSENLFISNTRSVYSFNGLGSRIEHSDFKANVFAIVIEDSYQMGREIIEYNDFSVRNHNNYGIWVIEGAPNRIEHNNFYFEESIFNIPNAEFWYITNHSTQQIQASNNWWQVYEIELDTFIWDKKDDPRVGLVVYEPIASEPIEGTVPIQVPDVHILNCAPFSPNNDGQKDQGEIVYSLSKPTYQTVVSIIDVYSHTGQEGAILWERVLQQQKDEVHTLLWDGFMEEGGLVPEGIYGLKVRAESVQDPSLYGEANSEIIVDITPPTIQIQSPSAGDSTYHALIPVFGQVFDLNLLDIDLRVQGKPAILTGGAEEGLNFQGEARLISGANTIEVLATDAAGNERFELIDQVTFNPAILIEAPNITNEEGILISGLYDTSLISDLRLKVRYPAGDESQWYQLDTESIASRWQCPQLILLALGYNLIIVEGLDEQGSSVASQVATIEYNPYFGQELEKTFPSGLQMITIPLQTDSDDAKVALGLSGALKLARWQRDAEGFKYVYYGATSAPYIDGFRPGYGYWMELDKVHTTTLKGTIANPNGTFILTLYPGWNLIGNPFLTSYEWQKVQVALVDRAPVSWSKAVEEGWIRPGLWTYSPGGYKLETRLEPWCGYWVRALEEVDLIFTPSLEGQSARVESQMVIRDLPHHSSEWRLELIASNGMLIDGGNIIGIHPLSTDGFDLLYDIEKPPPFGDTLYLALAPVDGSGVLARDWRSSGEHRELVWNFTVHFPNDSEEITLRWLGSNSIPNGWSIRLIDEQNGQTVMVNEENCYVFSPKSQDTTRSFSIRATQQSPLNPGDIWIYPNPTDLSNPVNILFTSSDPARVQIGIYDLAGRLIKVITESDYPPGIHEISWDGLDALGRKVPNGLYLVRIEFYSNGKKTWLQGRLGVLK